ncbi:DNA (apurinic or apyrimidinic site) lyase, endon uclease [Talaromyces stipitatus ATCC 10500]|uniref:Apurinic-apyrimidinic endonuclease 1 n=1 Tax=Talaromyces stipitatus (strain ATCC 10500 / CBS 375.48 / QM 6759 / NRRL 1006) TaxID=441959 RepID=B8M380_TALSN|nr:DNA (apurinic or apyrimidinic site) lyase, endon uclease [Talaromyces stipitatus ATCC 10500]EED22056.1 DNA (apurinic or apyrimidinic site) lyase, endon uclease [Talaromyces stipitatus ATCC 10500]
MPARNSRPKPGAVASPAPDTKKRPFDETEENSLSPRRPRRTRSTTENVTAKPFPALANQAPRKPSRLVSANSKKRGTAVEIKEEEAIEADDLKAAIRIKKQKLSIAAQESDTGVKKEVEIEEEEEEEEEIIAKKSTKKRKTKAEKDAEMLPLAARTKGLQMFVGAHVSAAKGVQNSVVNSVHIGGNAFALFLKSQRKWENPPLQDENKEQFLKFCLDHEYDAAKYILPHGSYLVNLAQEDEAKAKQAYDSFLDDLQRCEKLGIRLYNFHPGAAGQTTVESAISRLAQSLTKALAATETVTPVLETMCGHGTTLGGPLSELGAVISQIPEKYHSRIGVCVDTCHSFSYGYDLASPEGFRSFMQEFDDKIGLKFLRALHLNDSKAPKGSKRDLHANIGTGFLGLRAFHNVMNEKRFQGLPMILETPIDRPVPDSGKSNKSISSRKPKKEEDTDDGLCDSDHEIDSPKAKKARKAPSTQNKLVEDKSVWAREIKLLESLIGMDPESSEFRALETQLSGEGRAERKRHQEQYERKLETEAKKKQKQLEKGQKGLDGMFKKKE